MAFPAVPRNAKDYDIENAINRILRWLNPGFGASNAGKVLASNSNGTDLEWTEPTLSDLTNSLAADVALSNTSDFFDGPSVAQGTTGIWLAIGQVTVTDTAGAAHIAHKLWDGTTVISTARCRVADQFTHETVTLVGVIENPAGNIRISCKDITSTSGLIDANVDGDNASTLTVVRIG